MRLALCEVFVTRMELNSIRLSNKYSNNKSPKFAYLRPAQVMPATKSPGKPGYSSSVCTTKSGRI